MSSSFLQSSSTNERRSFMLRGGRKLTTASPPALVTKRAIYSHLHRRQIPKCLLHVHSSTVISQSLPHIAPYLLHWPIIEKLLRRRHVSKHSDSSIDCIQLYFSWYGLILWFSLQIAISAKLTPNNLRKDAAILQDMTLMPSKIVLGENFTYFCC